MRSRPSCSSLRFELWLQEQSILQALRMQPASGRLTLRGCLHQFPLLEWKLLGQERRKLQTWEPHTGTTGPQTCKPYQPELTTQTLPKPMVWGHDSTRQKRASDSSFPGYEIQPADRCRNRPAL